VGLREIAAILGSVAALTTAFVGLGTLWHNTRSHQSQPAPTTIQEPPALGGTQFTQEGKDEFITQCVSLGHHAAVCECTVEALEHTISFSQLEQAEHDMAAGKSIRDTAVAGHVDAAIRECEASTG